MQKCRNAVLFEHKINDLNPKMTGQFQEFLCAIDLSRADSEGRDVAIEVNGVKKKASAFKLQPMPPKKGNHPQVRVYLPDTIQNQGRSRIVHIQKYFLPKAKNVGE